MVFNASGSQIRPDDNKDKKVNWRSVASTGNSNYSAHSYHGLGTYSGMQSILSVTAIWSILSVASIGSLLSVGSVFSVLSQGCVFSWNSVVSMYSINSTSSTASIASLQSYMSINSSYADYSICCKGTEEIRIKNEVCSDCWGDVPEIGKTAITTPE